MLTEACFFLIGFAPSHQSGALVDGAYRPFLTPISIFVMETIKTENQSGRP